MHDLSGCNPSGRFTGLSEIYARYRPGYPAEAIDYILSQCRLSAGSLLIDVGCGTGISSRLFAERKLKVVGLEPNADMLSRAQAEPGQQFSFPLDYRCVSAEDTGLASSIADVVLAAQSFHWFQAQPALREFHRILKPGGWCILMWNERDESDPFTAQYGVLIKSLADAPAVEVPRGRAGIALMHSDLFKDQMLMRFSNQQILDEEALLGRAFSASYAPREPELADRLAQSLRQLFARCHTEGKVVIKYQTSVYVGQRSTIA